MGIIIKYLKNIPFLINFYYLFKNKFSYYSVKKSEFIRFKATYEPFYAPSFNENSCLEFKGNVLLLCNHENYYSIKIELLFALLLKYEGRKIYFLCDKSNYWINKYIKWSKIGEILFIQDYFNKNYLEEKKIKISELQNLDEIKKITFKGAWVGPQILSSLFRSYKSGVIDFQDFEIKIRLSNIIQNSIKYVNIAEFISESIKFDMCVVNEPNYEINGALVDILIKNEVDVIQYIQPSKDEALILKRLNKETRRAHPASVSKENFTNIIQGEWNDEFDSILEKEFTSRYNGSNLLQKRNQAVNYEADLDILSLLGISKKDKKIACIFCPVLWDANLFYGEDLFEDFGDWLRATLIAASKNDNLIWLLKLHPANSWKMQNEGASGSAADYKIINSLFKELPENIIVIDPDFKISTLNLFKIIDYGITVRGTIGLELPCFGIPILTAGTGRYSDLGFTIDSKSKKEYLDKLSVLEQIPPLRNQEVQLAKWHAYSAFILRPWHMKSFKTIFTKNSFGLQGYCLDFIPLINSIKELNESEDIKKLKKWFNSNNTDFLNE
jgi:hypothetical protein